MLVPYQSHARQLDQGRTQGLQCMQRRSQVSLAGGGLTEFQGGGGKPQYL